MALYSRFSHSFSFFFSFSTIFILSGEADLAFCHAGGLDWDARAALSCMGEKAQVATSIDTLLVQVLACVQPGDHILCMSNGGFGGIHTKLIAALQHR